MAKIQVASNGRSFKKNMQAVLIANGHLTQSSKVPIAALDSIPASSSRNSMSSHSSKNATGSRGRRERPCDGCRKRKSKCVVNEGQKNCAACGVHGQECTYVEDPQPRKRKVDTEAKEGDGPKRRLACPPPRVRWTACFAQC